MRDFIGATRAALASGNWYAAVTVALTIPDICGRLEAPQEGSQARFVRWYDRYLLAKYQVRVGPTRKLMTFLNGNDCYALRCAFLHQGEFEIDDQRARQVLERFHFTAPRRGMIVHNNMANGNTLQLQVDCFCSDVCDSAESWLKDVAGDADVQARIDLLGAIW